MKSLRFILGDQLSPDMSSLADIEGGDIIFMCEVLDEATYVKHHKQKLVFIFSAMRHFADELRGAGHTVDYIKLDDDDNTGTLTNELKRAIDRHSPDEVTITEPGEYRVLQMIEDWRETFDIPVHIRSDQRFLCDHDTFQDWAAGRKSLTMEYFYRDMRKRYNILMDGNDPEGGQWNFDKENRKPPKADMNIPDRDFRKADKITKNVMEMVEDKFSGHVGNLDNFTYGVSRAAAESERNFFFKTYLPRFGDYQDAMITGEAWLYHSRLSAYMNIGLLDPLDLCKRAENAYYNDDAPLNAVEGFIRQILGWREYVRGIYWLKMPGYAEENFLEANTDLPDFYWTADTELECLKDAITNTLDHAYAHHIQRLMITGNFALLIGADIKQVTDWYLEVYADAYEWVELPNTLGMALFADGGVMASKPYAASGKYIDRMSNHCKSCTFNPKENLGDDACPFNSLYWDFIARNEDKLSGNHRMRMVYASLGKMDETRVTDMREKAQAFIESLT